MAETSRKDDVEERVDVGDVTLAWGDRTTWKARLRDESQQRHQQLSLSKRVRAALDLVMPARR